MVSTAAFLPDGLRNLRAEGEIGLGFCVALKTLPDGLTVSGNLSLFHCQAFETLPADLTVTGYLSLYGCKSEVQEQGKALKAAGKIVGDLLFD